MKTIILLFLLAFQLPAFTQEYVVKDIKTFGAKGDGKTNDHDAFIKAAEFFNKRGGKGKLLIPAGTYIVGQQMFNRNSKSKPVYEGGNVLDLKSINDFTIEGQSGSILKYSKGLRFGAFDHTTGKPNLHGKKNFFTYSNAATIGSAVSLIDCKNISIKNVELNGNSNELILGGGYGDVGRQLPHTGIYIVNSSNITVENVKSRYFGLDGMQIVNKTTNASPLDQIILRNCIFEYNARQGLSWVGGNDLTAINCKFNHTGKGKFSSAPGAGVDIEAEVGPISNGKFIGCEFINNVGCGVVADSGPSSNCTFTDCFFWGVTAWSIWVNNPGFTFINSKIYGSIVHGFDADTEQEATKFIGCHFEDKPYNGQEAFGNFLIESNNRKRMRFENCTMVANTKKLAWITSNSNLKPEEKYQLINCHFQFQGSRIPAENWVAALGNVRIKNNVFSISHPKAKEFYFTGLKESNNINLGGNKFRINQVESKF
jgi:hypothetical protein